MQTSLVVGGGFISSHLQEKLKERGDKVVVLHHDQINNKRYNPFDIKFDHLYYLAAYGNHSFQDYDEETTFQANVIDVRNAFLKSRHIKYKSFVFVSTSSVRLDVQTMYSATKGATESLLKGYSQVYQKPIVICRPTSVYGEGESDRRFIPTMVRKILHGDKIFLAPDPVHDWIYVGDFCDGMVKASEQASTFSGTIFEFGTELETQNKTVLKLIARQLKKDPQVQVIKNARIYDTKHWRADNSISALLNWRPQYKLTEGLERTVNWYVDRYAGTEKAS